MTTKLQQIDNPFELLLSLKNLQERKDKIWIWQKRLNRSDRRPVHYAVLHKINESAMTLEFRPYRTNKFKFDKSKDIFIYAESESISFKMPLKACNDLYVTCKIPEVLHILPAKMFENIEVIEIEDEMSNVHKRKVPRTQAKAGQLAGLVRTAKQKKGISLKEMDLDSYVLHDISPGGMAFLVDDPGEFDEGENIALVSIDGKLLGKPLVGDIRSIRKLDGELDQFKVGVKFE